MGILRKRGVNVGLEICGEGPFRGSLEHQVVQLELAGCVNFRGFVDHQSLPSILSHADVFVGPSATSSAGEAEGLGLALLEAQASGLPLVASNVGGISEVIVDGQTGILVHQKDPSAIAQAVASLIGNPTMRATLVENGQRRARESDWSKIADTYLEAYGLQPLAVGGDMPRANDPG